MDGVLKKSVALLVILFLGFWLVQDPRGFGDSAVNAITGLWDTLMKLFEAIIKSLSN